MENSCVLHLIRESKISDLMPDEHSSKRWEASGILVKSPHFYVVFDDRAEVARLADDLQPNAANELLGTARKRIGYEGIAYNPAKERYYLLVEARELPGEGHQAAVLEYDADFKFLKDCPLDFTFKSANKGFEAVAYARRDDTDYLFALCEGNKCSGGKKGRTPGGGRVQLFEKGKKRWRHTREIALPPSLPFVDYSGMSVADGRVAIVSQVNSMLWVGHFDEHQWQWRDEGQLHEFPRTDDGAIRYGNIEGVGWLTPTRIVTVSDRRKKKDQPDKRLAETDQSIHVFEMSA